jgi:hypothetical protein
MSCLIRRPPPFQSSGSWKRCRISSWSFGATTTPRSPRTTLFAPRCTRLSRIARLMVSARPSAASSAVDSVNETSLSPCLHRSASARPGSCAPIMSLSNPARVRSRAPKAPPMTVRCADGQGVTLSCNSDDVGFGCITDRGLSCGKMLAGFEYTVNIIPCQRLSAA